MKRPYLLAFIGLFLALLFILNPFKKPEPIIQTNTEYIIDTVTIIDSIPFTVYVPKPFKVIDSIFIPAAIDTQEIINNYYSKVFYTDTLVNDSLLQVIINDTIFQNRIHSRSPVILRGAQVITKEKHTETISQDNGFYAGGLIGQNIGISIDYKHNYNLFGVMYDKNGLSLKYSRKLKFK